MRLVPEELASSGEDRFVNKWLQYGGRVYRGLDREGSDEICQEPVARVSTFSLSADEFGAEPEHPPPFPLFPRGVCARLYGASRLLEDVRFPALWVEPALHRQRLTLHPASVY